MTVVRRAQTGSVIRKKQEPTNDVRSTRQPSRLEEMADTSFGTLDATKDGQIVSFDKDSRNFVLITPDDLLAKTVEDQNISDEFITQLETEINLANVSVDVIDGGGF